MHNQCCTNTIEKFVDKEQAKECQVAAVRKCILCIDTHELKADAELYSTYLILTGRKLHPAKGLSTLIVTLLVNQKVKDLLLPHKSYPRRDDAKKETLANTSWKKKYKKFKTFEKKDGQLTRMANW